MIYFPNLYIRMLQNLKFQLYFSDQKSIISRVQQTHDDDVIKLLNLFNGIFLEKLLAEKFINKS